MMKFFRKYMKYMLVLFMALLVGVWVVGDAMHNLLRGEYTGARLPAGEVFGRVVRLGDMEPAFTDTQLLERMGIIWQMPWVDTMRMMGVLEPQLLQTFVMAVRTEPLDGVEWFMLDTAARRAGIHVPDEAVDRIKMMYGIEGERLHLLRQRAQISLERIDAALRSYIRVLEAIELDNRGIKPTQADIEDFIRRTQEKVRLAAVIMDSNRLVDAAYLPSDEELIEQFESGQDRRPERGTVLEPGYLQPEKAQVEFIAIKVDALADRQRVTDEEAYRHWQEHRDEFIRPQPPTEADGPPTEPAEDEPYATFSEAREDVLEKLRQEKARVEALRIARDLIVRLNRPWRQLEPAADDATAIPEGVDSPEYFTQIVEPMQARHPAAVTYGRTLLADAQELSTHPQLGRTHWSIPGTWPIPFAQAALMVEGLETAERDGQEAERLKRRLYETCPEPFLDQEGNVYVFRTVAIRQHEPPPSWEEIRDRLADDVRRRRAYERAGELAEVLAEAARTDEQGLDAAFQAENDLKQQLGDTAFSEPEPFARNRLSMFGGPPMLVPNWIPDIGMDAALIEQSFAVADETVPQADRTFVHAQPERGRWIVAEVRELLPVTTEEFAQQRELAFDYTQTVMNLEFLANWFDSEQIRSRVGWRDIEPETDREQEPDEESVVLEDDNADVTG